MKRHLALIALIALVASWLGGCGGGDGVGEGGTGSFTSGRIGGFGSVIVNGIRFDDSGAVVRDDENATRRREDLRLGMVVAIESTRIDAASARAKALSIEIISELVGPVESVDVAGGRFIVLGQAVQVTGDTLFDERLAGGVAALRAADTVEVFGFFDSTRDALVASRIDSRSSETEFKLRAPIEAIDVAGRTIRIGGRLVATDGLALPPGLAPGATARVSARFVDGRLVATRIDDARPRIEDHDDAHIEGRIESLGNTRSFKVDGLPVDARNAAFRQGETGIVPGARVEVEGALVGGVLIAREVKVEDAESEFELRGEITDLDSSARTFVVRGVAVGYGPDVRFDDGAEAQLENGRTVHVEGVASDGGTRLRATRIKLER